MTGRTGAGLTARRRHAFRTAGVALLLAWGVSSACAEVRGIVVGFNDYLTVPKLNGALNDVDDVASALRKRGVTDLSTMTDSSATIADFDRRWNEIVARSKPGDIIIFSFAGHGVVLRDRRVPQKSPDGKEKGFLFPTFDKSARPDAPAFNELLRDEDLYDRFQATAAKGIRVIFVADACHAGSGVRSADIRSAGKPFRFAPVVEADAPALPPPVPQAKRPPIPNVTVFSAQIEERTILEIRVDGQNRGALSYTFARGIEGAADRSRSGSMTVGDLWQFTREGVRTRSDNTQSPEVYTPQAEFAKPVFTTGAPPPPPPSQRDINIFSLGRQIPIERAAFTNDRKAADVIWDPGRRQLIGAAGDILSSEIGDAGLQGAVDARQLIEYLRSLADTKGNLRVAVRASRDPESASSDRIYLAGERISLAASGLSFRSSTVLAISADGTVTLLFPTGPNDLTSDGAKFSGIVVQEPYGTDIVAFINTERSLDAVSSAFQRMPRSSDGMLGAMTARAVLDLLRNDLGGLPLRIGMQAVVTCRIQRADKTCDTQLPSSR